MRILIAYASKNNTTQTCAKMLADKLPGADVVNLSFKKPDISSYDTIVIGSNIRFNYINKAVKNFIDNNIDTLMQKRTAIYLCCGFPEKANQYLLHNFPKKLLNNSISIQCLGGILKVNPHRIIDKFIMTTVVKNYKLQKIELPQIDNESLLTLVKDVTSKE